MKCLLCGIGKMENQYIREWVEYHKNIGFDNIVLYDNNDVDGEHFEDVIGDYIKDGFVILKNWRGRSLAQIPAYNECYKEYRKLYDWICYFDIDEFVEFEKAKTIQEFLSDSIFDGKEIIRLCWKSYTDNGLISVENDNYSVKRFTEPLTFENGKKYGLKLADIKESCTQCKSFVRTTIPAIKVDSPHVYIYDRDSYDAVGNPCAKNRIHIGNAPVWKGAWLNHYRFKTVEEYINQKMVRLWPTAYGNGGKSMLNLDFFFRFNKKTPEKMKFAESLIEKKKVMVASWTRRTANGELVNYNWGDELNFYFLQEIMDGKLIHHKKGVKEKNYSFIGSVVFDTIIDSNTIIWGSGIPRVDKPFITKPAKVCAVRGPLTRDFLMKRGIQCPEVYGDPALLLPYYYKPQVKKKYKIGIIPHWSSLHKCEDIFNNFKNNKDVRIIRLKNYTNWKDIIDEILSCEYIVSESLHGLIVAEAYGIPNLWAYLTFDTQNIKYHDFFLSMGKDREAPYTVTEDTTVNDLLKELAKYEKSEGVDLQKLVDACPVQLKNLKGLDLTKKVEKKVLAAPAPKQIKSEKVLLGCIVKMENNYLEEWIKHYQNLGFDKIVIYDNNESSGQYSESVMDLEIVQEGVKNGKIDVINVPDETKIQCRCYTDCYKKYGDDYKWLAFFDIDEYLMLEKCNDIHEYLNQKEFNTAQIIHINWKIYDDNGLITVKDGDYSLVKRFTREMGKHNPKKARLNRELKSIVRGGMTNIAFDRNPHTVTSKALHCVDAIGRPANSAQQGSANICHKGAWLNHYITKTIEEYAEIKAKRGGGVTQKGRYNFNFFFTYNDRTDEKLQYLKESGIVNLKEEVVIKHPKVVPAANVVIKTPVVKVKMRKKTINDFYRESSTVNAIY